MKPTLFVAAIAFGSAQASPIINMTSYCMMSGLSSPVMGTAECETGEIVAAGYGTVGPYANAQNLVAYDLQPILSNGYSTLSIKSSARALAGTNGGIPLSAMAMASASISVNAMTLGDVRPGLLHVFSSGGFPPYDDITTTNQASADFRIGSVRGEFRHYPRGIGGADGCYLFIGSAAVPCFSDITVPFTLGTEFLAMEEVQLSVCGCIGSSYSGYVSANVPLQFRLTELDGTPVTMISNPEPGTWALMLGAAVLAGIRRLRRP